MSFLQGKRVLITGLISNRSIAYGIASSCHRYGAELAFTYQNERFADRVRDMAAEFAAADRCFVCDVSEDTQIDQMFADLSKHWKQFDGLLHAIAFAPREAIGSDFLGGCTRESFRIAQDVSAYSLVALARAALPYMKKTDATTEGNGNTSSILTLSYLGAERVVPNYNTMGLAKASLEAAIRYLAAHMGDQGVRVNGLSPGPMKTLAASGIKDFGKLLAGVAGVAPLRRNVTLEDIGKAAAFYFSELSSGITGELTYVDAGFNVIAGSIDG